MGQATVDAALGRPSDDAIRAAIARMDARLAPPPPPPTRREIKWDWPSTAGRCSRCRRSSVPLLYTVRTRPTFTYGHDGPTGGIRILSAVCFDQEACFAYQQTKRAKAQRRTGLFILERPKAPAAEPPFCKWCGERIVLVEPGDYRRARRNYHRGDEYEIGNVDCGLAFRLARTYEPRVAVFHREVKAHGVLACVACGEVCAEPNPDAARPGRSVVLAREPKRWEADHRVPLEDGGTHELDNLQCLCCPCHRLKTARENRERAARRAKLPASEQPSPPSRDPRPSPAAAPVF